MPFQIVRNDITSMKADAVVNTANPEAAYARGTDAAVYQAAGAEKLLAARRKAGFIATGEAAITSAFLLDAKYIIHTVGPVWQGGLHGESDMLRLCYKNSLHLALEHGCESIAFPLISTGTYGFPKEEALLTALSAIRDFLSEEEMTVYLAVFDRESFELSGKLFTDIDSYIDENYVSEKLSHEYDLASASASSASAPSAPAPSAPPSYSGSIQPPMEAKLPPDSDALTKKMGRNALRLPKSKPQTQPQSAKRPKSTAPAMQPQAAQPRETERAVSSFHHPESTLPMSERSIDDVIAELGETFQQRLLRLIDASGLTDVAVYKKANLDRKLFSKIRCNANYRPKKATAIALALALELNLDETKDLLSRAELALSPSSKFDLIIQYFIDRKVYDIYAVNLALFKHGQPLLGE